MLAKRAQGRPARGDATVGPMKIVEGLQEALRALKTSNVTRKDVAHYAGVTPALVTYYFPQRETLIEAATVPIIEDLTCSIRDHIRHDADRHSVLFWLAHDIVACYLRNMYIFELYVEHKKTAAADVHRDLLDEISVAIRHFFDDWLASRGSSHYSGEFLANALLGLCRAVAYNATPGIDREPPQERVHAYARMICRMVVGGLTGADGDLSGQFQFIEAARVPKRQLQATPPASAIRDACSHPG